jgi:DEAD/DEAH box helicase domain-containing protein
MQDPAWFFGKGAEEARLNPDNPYILTDHAKCACFELPFRDAEIESGAEPFGPEIPEVLGFLEEEGIVRHTAGKWHWADRSYPAEGVSLRSAAADNVVIVDVTKGRNAVIGEMDRPSAKELIFKNAVYLHRGRQYLVEDLDIPNRKCLVREAEVNYFTDALVKTDIKGLSEDECWEWGAGGEPPPSLQPASRASATPPNGGSAPVTPPPGGQRPPGPPTTVSGPHFLRAVLGDVLVRSQAAKFKKIRFHTHENIGYGDIDLPEEEMQTRALALCFGPETAGGRALAALEDEERAGAALSGAGSLLKHIAPAYLLCESRDLGVVPRTRDPHFGVPALFIYDKYPGGTGLAEALSTRLGEFFPSIRRAVNACPCRDGCPSCVGPGADSTKADTTLFLEALV